MTRREALASGLHKYRDGKTCKRGHSSLRYVRSGACVECVVILKRERREKFPNEAKEQKAKWRAENPGVHAARARDYRARNLEKVRATERAYRLEKPEKKAAKDRNRRARIKGVGGRHRSDDIASLLAMQKFKCAYCGTSVRKRGERHVDHIIPIAKGGSNARSNLQILCPSCNRSKGDRLPEEYARTIGLLV